MNAGFDLNCSFKGTPFIAGSLQDAGSLTAVHQGMPFLVANQRQGATFTYDTRARLNTVNFTSGRSISYNLDAMGNRTSVVTT